MGENREVEEIEISIYKDECPQCGVWMLNPERHKAWHEALFMNFKNLQADIKGIKINPFTGMPLQSHHEAPK